MIHADLERWGSWNRERYQAGMCSSIEQRFDSSGGREPSKAIVSLPPDPMLARIEWTVTLMQQDQTPIAQDGRYVLLRKPRSGAAENAVLAKVEQLGETLTEFYCKGWPAKTICWGHGLRYELFAEWMYDCRSTLLTRLTARARNLPDDTQ